MTIFAQREYSITQGNISALPPYSQNRTSSTLNKIQLLFSYFAETCLFSVRTVSSFINSLFSSCINNPFTPYSVLFMVQLAKFFLIILSLPILPVICIANLLSRCYKSHSPSSYSPPASTDTFSLPPSLPSYPFPLPLSSEQESSFFTPPSCLPSTQSSLSDTPASLISDLDIEEIPSYNEEGLMLLLENLRVLLHHHLPSDPLKAQTCFVFLVKIAQSQHFLPWLSLVYNILNSPIREEHAHRFILCLLSLKDASSEALNLMLPPVIKRYLKLLETEVPSSLIEDPKKIVTSSPSTTELPTFKPSTLYSQFVQRLTKGRPIVNMRTIHLAPEKDLFYDMLTSSNPLQWDQIKSKVNHKISQLSLDPLIRRALATDWIFMLNGLQNANNQYCDVPRRVMSLFIQTLETQNISEKDVVEIFQYVASYKGKCSPTWVKATSQEIQKLLGSQGTIPNLIMTKVQELKNNLLELICGQHAEWHVSSAVKTIYGDQMGLNTAGEVLDNYTQSIIQDYRMQEIYRGHFTLLVQMYGQSSQELIQYVSDALLTCSDEQLSELNNYTVDTLTKEGMTGEEISEVMSTLLFPEDQDYKPSPLLALYLLCKLNILSITQDKN